MSTRAPRRGQGGYFRTKSVEQSIRDTEEPDHALNKSLSALDLTVFGVGVVIGTGIFVLTGQIARDTAGPSVALAFLVSGLVCALAALCYAEFASTVPVAGSAYTFSYASLGCAVVAVGWSGYVRSLMDNVGWHLPDWLSGAGQADGFGFDLLAFVLVGLVTAVLVAGMKLSARVTTLVVAIKLGVVLLVIVAGAFLVEADNYRPFIPPAEGTSDQGSGLAAPLVQVMFEYEPTTFGVRGVFTAAAIVFFAYIGFDIVATAAEETRDPQRDVPRGLLGSLAICTLLYVAVSLVVTGMRKYTELTVDAPLADAFKASGHPFYSGLISFGAAVGLTTVCLILLLGQTRVFFAMSRDGLLPRAFSPRSTRASARPTGPPCCSVPWSPSSPASPAPGRVGRAGEHRHAVRLRRGGRRRGHPAPHPPRPAARLPRPACPRAAGGLRAGLALADAQPADRDLAALRRLDGSRLRRLRRVRPLPQPRGRAHAPGWSRPFRLCPAPPRRVGGRSGPRGVAPGARSESGAAVGMRGRRTSMSRPWKERGGPATSRISLTC